MIRVRTCPLFQKSTAAYKNNKQVMNKLAEFIRVKTENPQSTFGAKDRAFSSSGNFPGVWHAGITFDLSVVYKISSVNGEKVLDLYGLFTHDELGTGQPRNINRQQSMGTKIQNQTMQ